MMISLKDAGLRLIIVIIAFLSGIGAEAAFASNQVIHINSSQNSFYIFSSSPFTSYVATLSIGPIWESAGQSQTLYLAPDIQKTYDANAATNSLVSAELFLGIQRPLCQHLLGQLGFAIVTASKAKLSGNVWDDANPVFNNYTYSYQIRHTHVAVKGKLLAHLGWLISPWVSASAGLGFNQSNNFTNTPAIYEAVQMPNFSSHMNTAFTYTIGVGVERSLTKNWQISAGYELTDWGKSQLGKASGQTLGSSLVLNHFYTNGLLLGVSYVA